MNGLIQWPRAKYWGRFPKHLRIRQVPWTSERRKDD